ncbi:uncharacterized protein [Arachis hypogaea]|uniref:uncharacterized protein isoform X1 n=1 Tax=Arachis hypogaea TaxID=3818 RepID=UPI003B221989
MPMANFGILLQVLELMKKCLESMPCYGKLGEIIHNVLFSDSSIHNTLFQISCTTAQVLEKLHVSRLFDSMIIKGIQLAIGSVLEILVVMLTRLSKDNSSSFPIFLQAVFSCTTKSVPLITCVTSLISYFWNPAIQLGAVKFISMLFVTADCCQPFLYGTTFFAPDNEEVWHCNFILQLYFLFFF